MRTLYTLVAAILLGSAASALGQPPETSGGHYDPYYVLPAEAGRLGAEVGLFSADASRIGDVSVVPVVAKFSLTDDLEVGARANLGVLNDSADDLSTVEVGAKYGLAPATALTVAGLLPVGDADDPGLSLGIMHSLSSGDLLINNWLQVGLLDGYTGGTGVAVSLLVEPTRAFGDRLTAYLDVVVNTNTDELADNLAVDLGPNLDLMLSENLVVNVGVTVGVAGDMKQDDVGLVVMALVSF